MNETDLKHFIFQASKATYASGNESIKQKEADGSTTLTYENGDYRYHDNYFGGEPYGGREVIFLNDKAVWMMVYYGFVYEGMEKGEVYAFLMESLRNTPEDSPMRGPALFEKDTWKYETSIEGNFASFVGVEKIFKDDICVYEARYLGGFVDQA